jgi:hypothetical protein
VLVALAAFLSASLPMKPLTVILLRYIRFSLFRPFVSGARKASGRGSPDKKLHFWGNRHGGEPEPEGCESKAEASQTPGAAKAPKQCRDERAVQGNATERITTLLVAGRCRNGRNPNHSHFANSGMAVAGILAAVGANAWLGNRDAPEYSAKTTRRRQCTSASETEPRSHGGKQNHRRNLPRSQSRNVGVTSP